MALVPPDGETPPVVDGVTFDAAPESAVPLLGVVDDDDELPESADDDGVVVVVVSAVVSVVVSAADPAAGMR